jgi:hypothetical protein
VGTAIGFVVLFAMAREYFVENWLAYGLVWGCTPSSKSVRP